MLGKGRNLYGFLAAKPMAALGKLTYNVYMVHILLMLMEIYTVKYYLYFSNINAFLMTVHYYIYALVAALVLSLLIECPMLKLEKLIIPVKRQYKQIETAEAKPDPEKKESEAN